MQPDDPIGWDDLSGLFEECRAMAHALLLREQGASIQSTALVLTALRRQRRTDQDWQEVRWANRKYFFGAIYKAMRRALIDQARHRKSQKRQRETTLDPERFARVLEHYSIDTHLNEEPEIVAALMQTLEDLKHEEPDWAAMIEHRFFSGLTLNETAAMMDVSVKTIQRWWLRARLVLHERLKTDLTS